jgi:hypothetical protein
MHGDDFSCSELNIVNAIRTHEYELGRMTGIVLMSNDQP